MTFSILARDPHSDAIGGAAATGSLCVGGWVLRGDTRAGLSASQGMAPSTLWGEDVLARMAAGSGAAEAVAAVVTPDTGRDRRQLSALARTGNGAVFSGSDNTDVIADRVFEGGVAAGNMLASAEVIDALAEGYLAASGDFAARLLTALRAADRMGGDFRGLQSAALLVVAPDRPPLTLRIDQADDPLAALDALYHRATTGDYAQWCDMVPTRANPYHAGN